MMINRFFKVFLVLIMMSSFLVVAQDQTQNKTDSTKATNNRINFINNLLQNSTAANKLKQSNNPVVKILYEDAQRLYKCAVTARDDNDLEIMNTALSQSTEILFKAIRLMEQKKLKKETKHKDFKRRIQSIEALLKAHKRVSKEKKIKEKHAELKILIQDKVSKANALVSQGNVDAAYKMADEAYVQVKVSIIKLRSGDTLVRSLHFASAKEEYLYELDRNDTHKMLVKLLLDEKLKDPAMKKRTKKYLEKAGLLRKEAESYAANKDYKAAIKSCENSTKQFVFAIRATGLYIPG